MTAQPTCERCGSTDVTEHEDVEPTFGELITWCVCQTCQHVWPKSLTS